MPGMMSDEEMGQLAGARGVEFERMFARMMIAHHNGAIQMAKDEQSKCANPDAVALATTIERAQSAEVGVLAVALDFRHLAHDLGAANQEVEDGPIDPVDLLPEVFEL